MFTYTADTDKTRQFCLVRVGGVNKLYELHIYDILLDHTLHFISLLEIKSTV